MKYKHFMVLFIILMMVTLWTGEGFSDSMSIVRTLGPDSLIAVSDEAPTGSFIIYFPNMSGIFGSKRELAGYFAVNFMPRVVDGTNYDSLSIWVKPVIRDSLHTSFVVAEQCSVIITDNIDWVTENRYHFSVTDPIGPCEGLEINVQYTTETAGDSLQIAPYLTIQ